MNGTQRRSRPQVALIAAIAAGALGSVAVGLPMGVATLDHYGPEGPLFIVIFPAIVLSLTMVGAYVAARVPRNPIGWLLEVAGLAMAIGIFGGTYVGYDHDMAAGLPLVVPIAWLSSWTVLPAVGMLVMYVPLLFPTGRFLGPRWRALGIAGLAGVVASGAGVALAPGPLQNAPWIENPLGLASAGDALSVVSTISNVATPLFFCPAVVSVFIRYRRAGIVERQQLKWFGLTAAVAVVAFVVSIPNDGPISDAAWQIGLVSLVLLPVAIGIAILRYRLFEIDRVISRTLSWSILTGLLVGVFIGAVVVMDAVMARFTQGRVLSVAASTLLAFALFQPLRRRVQTTVDRRFDRSRYDGERVIAAFGSRLRDQVDLDTLSAEVRRVAGETVRPAGAAVWLRNATDRPTSPAS